MSKETDSSAGSKPSFSLADLQRGAKRLATVEAPAEGKRAEADSKGGGDDSALVALYEKHEGDLDAIFAELGQSPEKAKKPHHRPKSAAEFAAKFMEGYYTIIAESEASDVAESKSSHK